MPRSLIANHPLARNESIDVRIDGETYPVSLRDGEAIVWISITKRNARRQKLTEATDAEPVTVFLAMIDSGCNETCVLHEWHLTKWARLRLRELEARGLGVRLHGSRCPVASADLWLHPYTAGQVEPPDVSDRKRMARAVKLSVSKGVVISMLRPTETFQQQQAVKAQNTTLIQNIAALVTPRVGVPSFGGIASWLDRVQSGRSQREPLSEIYPRLPLIGMKTLMLNNLTFSVEAQPEAATSRFSLSGP